jgi:hypothetical protein
MIIFLIPLIYFIYELFSGAASKYRASNDRMINE